MPNVTIYIKRDIWSRLLRKHKGDELAARHEIKAMVEEKYA